MASCMVIYLTMDSGWLLCPEATLSFDKVHCGARGCIHIENMYIFIIPGHTQAKTSIPEFYCGLSPQIIVVCVVV